MTDPYVDPQTGVLRNKLGIRIEKNLAAFELEATAQRISEGLPLVPLTADGYRQLHYHIFQDVYSWAGQDRTVDMAKDGSRFCFHQFIGKELEKRLALARADPSLKAQFAERAAEHLSELNAIHPFREGNGRTLRAFLVVLARQVGHTADLRRINPAQWNEASRRSFLTVDATPMRKVIAGALSADARFAHVADVVAAAQQHLAAHQAHAPRHRIKRGG